MKTDPVCGVHFFDWSHFDWSDPSVTSPRNRALWTFAAAFEQIGVDPDRVGRDVQSYVRQFEVMKAAGFDFLLYEWHGDVGLDRSGIGGPLSQKPPRIPHPNEHFYTAVRRAAMPVSMFYDLEIRFRSSRHFFAPNMPVRETIVRDIASFFSGIPAPLRAQDRYGRIPIVFYVYQFNTEDRDRYAWHRFYEGMIEGIEEALGNKIVIHLTCGYDPPHALPMVYAFQHFPAIRPYGFIMGERQSAANADSATFVLHYDCAGVAASRGETFVVQDVQILEEQLGLVRQTNPSFVFFYGWDEFYEGEHLVPSEEWGTHKLDLAGAINREIKRGCATTVKTALIITDDMLGALGDATEKLLLNQTCLLEALRTIFPVNDTVIAGRADAALIARHDFVVSLNAIKDAHEMDRLAGAGKTVFHFDPLGELQGRTDTRFVATGFYEADFTKLRTLFSPHLPLREVKLHFGSYKREKRGQYPWPEATIGIGTRPSVTAPCRIPLKTFRFVASKGLAEHSVGLPLDAIKAVRFIRGKERSLEIVNRQTTIRYPEIIEIDVQ